MVRGVWVPVPVRWVLVPPKLITLLHIGRNNLREGVPCPVQPRFDRAKIAVRDLGDLLVGLSLELPEDEDMPMMLGQLCHRFLDYFPQVPLPVHVIRPRGRVLELEWRSEERRVGKECRGRWSLDHHKKKIECSDV